MHECMCMVLFCQTNTAFLPLNILNYDKNFDLLNIAKYSVPCWADDLALKHLRGYLLLAFMNVAKS